MPKIYEYLGFIVFIYTDDHPHIHIHVQHGDNRAKIELYYEDGVLTLKYKKIRGFDLLTAKQQGEMGEFIESNDKHIVEKWTQIHVLKQTVKSERITQRVKRQNPA